MKITEDVRRYAAERGLDEGEVLEAGMKEKSEEFLVSGGEVYQPED
jgi:phosphomethylpyrimidine synthase